MKVKTISITLARRLSDGNYGTYGGEVTVEAELEEGDKSSKVSAKLTTMAEEQLDELIKITAAKKSKTKKE